MSLSGSSSDTATYSPLHICSANFGGIGGVEDANTTGAVVPGGSPMAGIGVATIPEGTEVPLFLSTLLARRNDGLMVVGVLLIKGMDLKIAAGGVND